MFTNLAVYNLSKSKVKRKIAIKHVTGCTVSKKGIEFVIHVPTEYDYRYGSEKKRDAILENLNKLYPAHHDGKQLPFFWKDETDLTPYTTTKSDAKKGTSRIPRDAPTVDGASIVSHHIVVFANR
jgi:serum/glucocorticoid-regulated kinase 2